MTKGVTPEWPSILGLWNTVFTNHYFRIHMCQAPAGRQAIGYNYLTSWRFTNRSHLNKSLSGLEPLTSRSVGDVMLLCEKPKAKFCRMLNKKVRYAYQEWPHPAKNLYLHPRTWFKPPVANCFSFALIVYDVLFEIVILITHALLFCCVGRQCFLSVAIPDMHISLFWNLLKVFRDVQG
jgi:hypothetical protein